jgi:hypothetical protein
MDYPFKTWKDYYAAFEESLNTEFYMETYPEYYKKEKSDFQIIKEFLESGMDSQEGLDGFVNAILNGSRYATELGNIVTKTVKMFVDAGANPTLCFDIIFEPNYDFRPKYFEDEVHNYNVRGMLIDVFMKHGLNPNEYYDFSSIKGTYWEDIDDETIENNYGKALFMVLKYYSYALGGTVDYTNLKYYTDPAYEKYFTESDFAYQKFINS